MSDATDLLQAWLQKAAVRAPSITRVTLQRWPGAGTPPHFKPGIGSYGWGINGHLVKDGNGQPTGLSFGEVRVWFSDRGQAVSAGPPEFGTQFASSQSDRDSMTFTIDGDRVRLDLHSLTWGGAYTSWTDLADAASGQLLFRDIPPAGPDPVRATMIVGFADTGEFGWL